MRPGIDPKVDYAFKRLFGREQNRALLLHFLNAVLELPPAARLTELQLLNPFGDKDALDDKLSIVDVKARDRQGRLFHIEMQVLPERAFRSRVLFYWANLHRQQLAEGEPYGAIRPTISVCITNFVLFPEVHDHLLRFELLNAEHRLCFSPNLLLVSLELPKFDRQPDQLTGALDMWTYFLRHGEELETDGLPATLDTPEIHRALEELTVLSQNDLDRERYEARLKLQRDELSRLYSAREEGLEQGLSQGLSQGLAQGLAQGIEKGQAIGTILAYQDLLQRPRTPREQLLSMSSAQLEQLAQQLKQELGR